VKILVYKDYGVSVDTVEILYGWLKSNLPKYDVEYTDATSIIQQNVLDNNVKAFVMPGGQSRAFKQKLEVEGDKRIQSFVENGGIYYGFCGGGYYPCREIDFTGEEFSINKVNNAAVFFNGVAKGSIPELVNGKYYEPSFLSSGVAELSYDNDKKANIYYHGGARFIGDFNSASCKVIATYDKLADGQNAAVIKCQVGNGYAVLSGVHPEIGYKDMDFRIHNNIKKPEIAERARKIKGELEQNDSENTKFHRFLLNELM